MLPLWFIKDIIKYADNYDNNVADGWQPLGLPAHFKGVVF